MVRVIKLKKMGLPKNYKKLTQPNLPKNIPSRIKRGKGESPERGLIIIIYRNIEVKVFFGRFGSVNFYNFSVVPSSLTLLPLPSVFICPS